MNWLFGFISGAAWFSVNIFLMDKFIKTVLQQGHKKNILMLGLVKVPVLYSCGYFILSSRIFPITSLLSGITLILLLFGVLRICMKQA